MVMYKMRKKNKPAFSLIELLAAIIIISLLATVCLSRLGLLRHAALETRLAQLNQHVTLLGETVVARGGSLETLHQAVAAQGQQRRIYNYRNTGMDAFIYYMDAVPWTDIYTHLSALAQAHNPLETIPWADYLREYHLGLVFMHPPGITNSLTSIQLYYEKKNP